MISELECPYGEKYGHNCDLIGVVEISDASFDHEFGAEIRNEVRIVSFEVMAYINGFWEHVQIKDEKTLEAMKEHFLEFATERLIEKRIA